MGSAGRASSYLKDRLAGVALSTEEEIFDAVRFLLDRHQYLVEPSAAVTVAALLTGKAGRIEGPVVAVLSGRNVALPTRPEDPRVMRVVSFEDVRRSVPPEAAIGAMREALLAQARGECDTPMPMHLDVSAGGGGEVHIKSSYRQRRTALRPQGRRDLRARALWLDRPLSTSAPARRPRSSTTADISRTCGRPPSPRWSRGSSAAGTARSGFSARACRRGSRRELHAAVLPLERVHVWGRNPERAEACARDIAVRLPGVRVAAVASRGRGRRPARGSS